MPFPKPTIIYQKIQNLASLASEQYQDLINVYFRRHPDSDDNTRTYPIKSLGFSQYGTNATLPGAKVGLGIGSFQPSTGTYGYLYAAFDDATPKTQIYSYRSSSADPTSEGATAKFDTNRNTVEFEQANDTLYITNGVDSVVKRVAAGTWSALASGAPLSGANTVAKYLCWHNFMMFAARTQAAPNILYISDAGAPDTFTGPITKTFPYTITGLKSLGEYLIVYTEKTIHAVTGFVPSTVGFREIPNAHPCVSHRSIVTTVRQDAQFSSTGSQYGLLEHWYLGHDYVWAFNGSTFRILGKDSWENYRSNLSLSQLGTAAATYDTTTGQYWLSIPTGANTVNNVTWAYDPTADVWIEKPLYTASCWTKHGSPNPGTYFLDSGAVGRAYLANSGQKAASKQTPTNGDHTASVTTITVDSTTGFLSAGCISVDDETIYYSGVTATEFTGCIRGYAGTTATAHLDNAVVYQSHKFRYRTRNLDFGAPELIKKFQVLWAHPKVATVAHSLSIQANIDRYGWSQVKEIDLMTAGSTWGSFTWGSSAWGAPEAMLTPETRGPVSGRGKTVAIGFEDNSSIQQTEVFEATLKLRPLKNK